MNVFNKKIIQWTEPHSYRIWKYNVADESSENSNGVSSYIKVLQGVEPKSFKFLKQNELSHSIWALIKTFLYFFVPCLPIFLIVSFIVESRSNSPDVLGRFVFLNIFFGTFLLGATFISNWNERNAKTKVKLFEKNVYWQLIFTVKKWKYRDIDSFEISTVKDGQNEFNILCLILTSGEQIMLGLDNNVDRKMVSAIMTKQLKKYNPSFKQIANAPA